MRKIIGLYIGAIATLVLVSSCSNKTEYRLATKDIVPDSNKVKLANFVKETVGNSKNVCSGSIWQAENTGNSIFSVKVEGLEVKMPCSLLTGCCNKWKFIPKCDLTKGEIHLLDSLKNN